jgi:hypothetical protein
MPIRRPALDEGLNDGLDGLQAIDAFPAFFEISARIEVERSMASMMS